MGVPAALLLTLVGFSAGVQIAQFQGSGSLAPIIVPLLSCIAVGSSLIIAGARSTGKVIMGLGIALSLAIPFILL
jgi:hypothetical protein